MRTITIRPRAGGKRHKLWECLRWEMTTSELKKLAETFKLDISDIPENSQHKRRIAKRIFSNITGSNADKKFMELLGG